MFELLRRNYTPSGSQMPLLQTLDRHQFELSPIKKAIAFGLGPIAGKSWLYDQPHLSHEEKLSGWLCNAISRMFQLIVFVSATEHLSNRQHGEQMKMYVQDPAFTKTDELFSQSIGIRVLHGQRGESLLDHTAFAYAPHMYANHTANVLGRCTRHRPALYIGNQIEKVLRTMQTLAGIFGQLSEDEMAKLTRLLHEYRQDVKDFDFCRPRATLEEDAHSRTKA